MDREGSLPGVPDDADVVYTAIRRALGDIQLSQEEREAIGTYVGREVPSLLDTRVTSYLVLGSYRDQYHKRLRVVEYEIGNRRTDTRAVVLGDTAPMEIDENRLPAFPVKFNVLATASDNIVMIMEKESGGEGVELGRIADGPYFSDSHILPRDYANFVSEEITSLTDAKQTALEIWFNQEFSESEKEEAIERLANETPIASDELDQYDSVFDVLIEFVTTREEANEGPATYSWVHLSDFRKFERAGRCYPWTTEESLREQVQAIPGPEAVTWSDVE